MQIKKLKLQIFRLEAQAELPHVGFDVFDKSRPRTLDDEFGLRLREGARGRFFGADDGGKVRSVQKEGGIAVQYGGADRLLRRLRFEFGIGDGFEHLFCGGVLSVSRERFDDEPAEQFLVDDAVGVDDRAGDAVACRERVNEDIFGAQLPLDCADVFLQRSFHTESMRKCGKNMQKGTAAACRCPLRRYK